MTNFLNLFTIKKFLKTFLFVFLFVFAVFNKEGKAEEEEKYCHFYYNEFKGLKDGSDGGKAFEVFATIPFFGNLPFFDMIEPALFFVVALGDGIVNDPTKILDVLFSLIGVVSFTESLPYQFVYDSNQYCGYQDIFKEEDSFLDSDLGRYSIFPVFPLDIKVGSSGQCEFDEDFFDVHFKNVVTTLGVGDYADAADDAAGAGITGDPRGTNCAYSYTKYNDTCFLTNTLPVYIEAEVLDAATSLLCSDINKFFQKDTKMEFIKNLKNLKDISGKKFAFNIVTEIVTDAADIAIFFTNFISQPIFNLDGYTLAKFYTNDDFLKIIRVIVEGLKGNPICSATILVNIVTLEVALPITNDITFGTQHDKAKIALQNLKFCGYDWYSYAGINKGTNEYTIPNKSNTNGIKYEDSEYFERGSFIGSYSYAVSNCINTNDDNICKNGSGDSAGFGICKFYPDDKKNNLQYVDSEENIYKILDLYNSQLFKNCKSSNSNKSDDDCKNLIKECTKEGMDYTHEVMEKCLPLCFALDIETICKPMLENFHYKPTDKTVYNKIFREFVYNGKEYKYVPSEDSEYKDRYDPRLPKNKGYYDTAFMFYMRGNEKANYACDRFEFDGKGCVMSEDDYKSGDYENKVKQEDGKTKDITEHFISNDKTFYIVNVDTSKSNAAGIITKCSDLFSRAQETCYEMSKKYVCIENANIYVSSGLGAGKVSDEEKITFCKANYENPDNLKERSTLIDAMRQGGDEEELCEVRFRNTTFGGPEDRVDLYPVKKYGGQYICVMTDNLCPYDFKLNAGLNYKDAYCGSDYVKTYYEEGEDISASDTYKYNISSTSNKYACEKGMFINNTCDIITNSGSSDLQYKQYAFDTLRFDVGDRYVGDMNEIYNYIGEKEKAFDSKGNIILCNKNIINNCAITTAKFGKIRNFCQYKAHCVKVEAEEMFDSLSAANASAFIDMSCNGKSVNSRNYIHVGLQSTHSRQLSSVVVECVYESLKNLVNGTAGYSSCKNGLSLNDAGYCGNDTKAIVEEKKKNGEVGYLNRRYHFIKGYELPGEVSVAVKLRKSMRTIVLAFMSLSVLVWGFKIVVLGGYAKTKDFADKNFVKGTMITVIKFCLICWLALENGWREGLADKLFNFTTSVYDFTSKILMDSIFTDKSTILKGETILGIEQTNLGITGGTKLMEFYYNNSFGLTYFEPKDSKSKNGLQTQKYITTSKNEDISALTYFVNKLNAENNGSTYKVVKITDINTLNYNSDINEIWNNNYDGCYFDTSEYDPTKTYLAIFDSLDCRIVRYLGITESMDVGNLILIGLTMIFLGTIGGFFLSMIMTFIFTIMNLLIEIVFTFINAFFTISLLIFVSPIILPLALFKRTESIFKKWYEKIISCVFHPVLIVITVLIFINILDSIILKNMTFTKHNIEGRYPNVECTDTVGIFCLINNVGLVFSVGANAISEGFDLMSSMIKTGSIDLENMPALSMLFDILIIYILFVLGDSIMSMASSISGSLFGNSGVEGKSGKPGSMIGSSFKKAQALSKEAVGYAKTFAGSVKRPMALIGNAADKIAQHREKKANQVVSEYNKHGGKIRELEEQLKDKNLSKKEREKMQKKLDAHKASKENLEEKYKKNLEKLERYKKGDGRWKKLSDGFVGIDYYTKGFGKNIWKEFVWQKGIKEKLWHDKIKGSLAKKWDVENKEHMIRDHLKKKHGYKEGKGENRKALKNKIIDFAMGESKSTAGKIFKFVPRKLIKGFAIDADTYKGYTDRKRAEALLKMGDAVKENSELKAKYDAFLKEKFGKSDVDLSKVDMSKISLKELGNLSRELGTTGITNTLKTTEIENLEFKRKLEKDKMKKEDREKMSFMARFLGRGDGYIDDSVSKKEGRAQRRKGVLSGPSKSIRRKKLDKQMAREAFEIEHMDDDYKIEDFDYVKTNEDYKGNKLRKEKKENESRGDKAKRRLFNFGKAITTTRRKKYVLSEKKRKEEEITNEMNQLYEAMELYNQNDVEGMSDQELQEFLFDEEKKEDEEKIRRREEGLKRAEESKKRWEEKQRIKEENKRKQQEREEQNRRNNDLFDTNNPNNEVLDD